MSFKRILIVDDEPSIRLMLKMIITDSDLGRVVESTDGDKALGQLLNARQNGKPFDLVISDWEMPRMGGSELLIAIRSDNSLSSTKFIMATSVSDKERIMEILSFGVDGYLVKPFQVRSVVTKIKDVLKSKSKH